MQKSQLAATAYAGRRVCQYNPCQGDRCHARATVTLAITSFPRGVPVTSACVLCPVHLGTVTRWYQR
jgi:hypothetical protein